MAINMHFCCGQLVDWAVNSEAQRCGEPATANKEGYSKNCCKEVHFFMLQDECRLASAKANFSFPQDYEAEQLFPHDFEPISQFFNHKKPGLQSHAPPLIALERYLVNGAFRL